MKALALIPGTTQLEIVERPEPQLKFDDDVKLKVLEVGICGTDREEAAGGRASAPPGQKELIIGHEMLGRVVETGPAVRSVKVGDLAVFTVRRGCGQCPACRLNRSDDCFTGDYTERGIKGLDGYQAEFAVDREIYAVPVDSKIVDYAVLTEPTSVAEKAIDSALRIQAARLPALRDPAAWLEDRNVLVAGLGPVGLLTAIALRLRGARVFGLDIVDAESERAALLKTIGATYVDGRKTGPDQIPSQFGPMEQIYDATGDAPLEFSLIAALGYNGVYALMGIPGSDKSYPLREGRIIQELVLKNQVLFGSVNESRLHVESAVRDLVRAGRLWGAGIFRRVITHRVDISRFRDVLQERPKDEIKAVIRWHA